MSTIGSLGSYAAQLWHTRANPNLKEQQQEAYEKAVDNAAAVPTKPTPASVPSSSAGYDEDALAKLKLGLNALAGSDSSSSDLSESDSGKVGKTASEEFHDWMNMTPGEKLRASILKELGITEEDLANMSPEARQQIEDGIAEKVQTLFAQQAVENQQQYKADHGASAEELINLTV